MDTAEGAGMIFSVVFNASDIPPQAIVYDDVSLYLSIFCCNGFSTLYFF
jgi:hypothetical protein